jgi:MFS transporter, SP family, solute carrier family 2 (myo-inositol transporter), member 13
MTQPSFDEKHQTKETSTRDEEIAQGVTAGETSKYAVEAEVEERTTWFVWLLVASCTISGLLFGMGRLLHF